MTPIAHIRTPFPEKFGIPRQPLLIKEAWGILEFPKNDFNVEAFRGLDQFSHLWLIFSFHQAIAEGTKALVRPPRFGGKDKWGVYATRSPHRPNHLGLSVVEFESLEVGVDKVVLRVRGVDLVDGTPIFDIKPYVPYCDSVSEAKSGPFEKPAMKKVRWDCIFQEEASIHHLIEKVVALDPRPSFDQESLFGVSVAGFNVEFKSEADDFVILKVTKV